MEQTNKFSYSFYENAYYSCEYDSIEEALEAAKVDAKNYDEFKDIDTVYIGRVCRFVPKVDAWAVMENLWDDAYEETIDSIDYLRNVSDAEAYKLEQMLTEVFNKWARETGNEPNFYTVEDVEEYRLEG